MDESINNTLNTDPTVGDELAPGTSLCRGQYEIVRYLNSGGFGITYLAHDSLGRKVVLKECFPGALCCRSHGTVRLRSRSHDLDFDRVVALFEREALALAQLQHQNIVGVHQIFKDNGTAYMAMDFVEGPDLFDLLETRPDLLDPSTVRGILDQLLNALAYVHFNNILHRDISPDNILLAPGQVPVLIDFGAAREDAKRATRMLSRIHSVKDGYSPQEFYLAGSTQEKSSDLYALAATIHHLIVGNPPPNSNVRMAAVAQNEPDPYVALTGRVSSYDDRFLSAIDTCLSIFAKDRLPNAEAWINMISAVPKPAKESSVVTISDNVKRRISELVTETGSYIEQASVAIEQPKVEAAPGSQEKTDNMAEELAYWAILNEDPIEIRKEIEGAKACQHLAEDTMADGQRALSHRQRRDKGPLSPRFGAWFFSFLAGRRNLDAKQRQCSH